MSGFQKIYIHRSTLKAWSQNHLVCLLLISKLKESFSVKLLIVCTRVSAHRHWRRDSLFAWRWIDSPSHFVSQRRLRTVYRSFSCENNLNTSGHKSIWAPVTAATWFIPPEYEQSPRIWWRSQVLTQVIRHLSTFTLSILGINISSSIHKHESDFSEVEHGSLEQNEWRTQFRVWQENKLKLHSTCFNVVNVKWRKSFFISSSLMYTVKLSKPFKHLRLTVRIIKPSHQGYKWSLK